MMDSRNTLISACTSSIVVILITKGRYVGNVYYAIKSMNIKRDNAHSERSIVFIVGRSTSQKTF